MTIKLSNRESEFKNYKLLLLVTHLQDYQVAHFLELAAGLHFKKYSDFPFATNGNNIRYYSWFHYHKEGDYGRYYLIENGKRGNWLFPQLKNIDFLLFIKGSIPERTFDNLKNSIKGIRGVSAVMTHNINGLHGVQTFFDEMELHELEYVIKPDKPLKKYRKY